MTGQADAAWEAASMMMNVAFWLMKHSAMMAVKAEVKVEEAKEVHTSLKKAAGIFLFVQVCTFVMSALRRSHLILFLFHLLGQPLAPAH